MIHNAFQGRIQDFKLGGAHLKKLRRAEGGAKNFGVFRVKNHDFTPKKIMDPPLPLISLKGRVLNAISVSASTHPTQPHHHHCTIHTDKSQEHNSQLTPARRA